jgi:hypothetical protein
MTELFELPEKKRSGEKVASRLSRDEFLGLLLDSAERIAARSGIINCQSCGRRFLVNTQDFKQTRKCKKGSGCNC